MSTPIFTNQATPMAPVMAPSGAPNSSMLGLAGLMGGGGAPKSSLIDPAKVMDLVKMISGGRQQNGAAPAVPGQPPQAQQIPSDQFPLGGLGRLLDGTQIGKLTGWFQPSAMNAYQGPGVGADPATGQMTPTGYQGG